MTGTTGSGDQKQYSAGLEARLEQLCVEINEIKAMLAERSETENPTLGAKVAQKVGAAADKAEEIGEDILEDILQEVRHVLDQVHKQAATLEKTLGVQTRNNPAQALMIAFGAGFLASLMLRR